MEFGVLGPLRVRVGGTSVSVDSPKHRILLAALLMNAGRTVPVSGLVNAMWEDGRPDNPRRTVQTYVARLRTLLSGAEPGADEYLVRSADGYLIDVRDEQVDLARFRRRLDDADRAASRSDSDAEAAALAAALAEGAASRSRTSRRSCFISRSCRPSTSSGCALSSAASSSTSPGTGTPS